jgi:formylglycine-generating enzyme required for sulfatase activity
MSQSLHAVGCAAALVFSVLAANDAAAFQVTPYGFGVNPPESLVLTSGVPQVGQSFSVGVSNTGIGDKPAALAFLGIASAADPAFPAGTVLPGFGLSSPGALGELLISLVAPDPLFIFGPVNWPGGTAWPAGFTVAVPANPGLSGVTFYLQGMLLDPTTGPSLGLTQGLAVKLAPPGMTGPVPCVSQFPGMAMIQQGSFQMGSNAAEGYPYGISEDQKPVHQVTLSHCFWMGETEVTQAEFQALMNWNPSLFLGPNKPVERVSWFEAQTYCALLTAQQSALGNVPAGYQYRLPTEAEWEYACRAGTTTEFNTGTALFCNQAKFGYSNHSSTSCNFGNTVPVGSYPANAWGLHDMHGNVLEWCLDSYAAYTAGAATDPFVTGGPTRVFRGGSWGSFSSDCRSSYRASASHGVKGQALGFRVVLAPILVP